MAKLFPPNWQGECLECHGHGTVYEQIGTRGRYVDVKCEHCEGTGYEPKDKSDG